MIWYCDYCQGNEIKEGKPRTNRKYCSKYCAYQKRLIIDAIKRQNKKWLAMNGKEWEPRYFLKPNDYEPSCIDDRL